MCTAHAHPTGYPSCHPRLPLPGGAAGCDDDEFALTPLYNHANGRIVIELDRDAGGRRAAVHPRPPRQLRRPRLPEADHRDRAGRGRRRATTIDGPVVDQALTKSVLRRPAVARPDPRRCSRRSRRASTRSSTSASWTATTVVTQIERDLFQAWDAARGEGIGGKADDPSGEAAHHQPAGVRRALRRRARRDPVLREERRRQVLDLQLPRVDPDPDDGHRRRTARSSAPQDGTVAKCDNPQYIYSLCEAGPRVATRINDRARAGRCSAARASAATRRISTTTSR